MKKRIVLTASVLLVAAALLVSGCRHHGCGFSSPEKRAEKVVEKLTDELELDEAQVSVLNSIKDRCLAKRSEVIEEHRAFGDELIAQVNREELDTDFIKMRVKENLASKEEIINELIDEAAVFHKTLSDSQKATLIELMEEIREKHRKYFN